MGSKAEQLIGIRVWKLTTRPSSLTSIVRQAAEQMLKERIMKNMKVNGNWDKIQPGYTKDRS